MKKLIPYLLCLLTGCAWNKNATPEENAQRVHDLTYAISSFGASTAMQLNPAYRPGFEVGYAELNSLVESGGISGTKLREIIAALPIKELKSPKGTIFVNSGTFLFDLITGRQVELEKGPYVVAAATGIRDGLKVALGK